MIKVLFACHGNICRSVMAEMMMKNELHKLHRESQFFIDSAATSREELGNPIYPPARRKLLEKGIDPGNHRARQVTPSDYHAFDLIIGMDSANVRNLVSLFGGDPENKVRLMMSYAGSERGIADPWYTDDFEATYQDLRFSIAALLESFELD